MKKGIEIIIFTLILSSAYIGFASAKKFPNLYFKVEGQVLDWDTKQPLPNAQVFVFLNDSPHADNNGWTKSWSPSKSDLKGYFSAISILYRDEVPKINKIELIVFRNGYRTERFFFEPKTTEEYPKIDISTLHIELPSINLLKLRRE